MDLFFRRVRESGTRFLATDSKWRLAKIVIHGEKLGTLRRYDGDGNENRRHKTIRLNEENNAVHLRFTKFELEDFFTVLSQATGSSRSYYGDGNENVTKQNKGTVRAF